MFGSLGLKEFGGSDFTASPQLAKSVLPWLSSFGPGRVEMSAFRLLRLLLCNPLALQEALGPTLKWDTEPRGRVGLLKGYTVYADHLGSPELGSDFRFQSRIP